MSLQIKLPLNGNLNNYGLFNSAITNYGAQINENGKAGKCYSYNNSNSNYTTISTPSFTGKNPISICLWFKMTASSTYSPIFEFGQRAITGLCIRHSSSVLRLEYGDGTNNYDKSIGVSTTLNTWYHICVTYDGTTIKVYRNCQNIYSIAGPEIGIGTNNLLQLSKFWAGYASQDLNDIRVYNHALSLKEISEIYNSINLICHYPFNDPYLFVQTNLIKSLGSGNNKVVKIENGFKFLTTAGDAYFSMSLKGTLLSTNKYVLSYWCDIQDGDRCSFGFYYSSGMKHIHTAKNGLNILVFQPTIDLSSVTFDDSNRSNSHEFTVTNLKIEEYNETLGNYSTPYGEQYNIVYDCIQDSNGEVNGQPLVLPVNKKYNYCTKFTGSQHIITNSLSTTPKAFSFWLQVDTKPSSNEVVFADGISKMAFGFYSSGTKIISSAGAARTVQNLNNKFIFGNTWNHVVVQAPNADTAVEVYINGTKLSNTSASNNWTHMVTQLYIGARNSGTVNTFGKFSIQDFRIYNKMFTQNEINEMIHIPINLDNKGNLFLSEINEMQYSNKVSFKKYGQVLSKNIKEDILSEKQASITKTGNIIINQVIEK